VGVGRETLSKDIQIGRVVTPKTALKGTTLMVDVVLSQSGFDGQQVTLGELAALRTNVARLEDELAEVRATVARIVQELGLPPA